jgi:hypothetical protein
LINPENKKPRRNQPGGAFFLDPIQGSIEAALLIRNKDTELPPTPPLDILRVFPVELPDHLIFAMVSPPG